MMILKPCNCNILQLQKLNIYLFNYFYYIQKYIKYNIYNSHLIQFLHHFTFCAKNDVYLLCILPKAYWVENKHLCPNNI